MRVNKLLETLNFENLKKGSLVLLSLIKDNQAEVLTGIALAAIPTTAIAAVQADRRANHMLNKAMADGTIEPSEEVHTVADLDLKTKTAVAGKYYIIPVLLAALAMGCTYASNYKSREKYAALAAVLAITETQNKDLIEQIEKLLGKEKKDEIIKGMTMDRINKDDDAHYVPLPEADKEALDASGTYEVRDYYGVKWEASPYSLERDWDTLQNIFFGDYSTMLYTWYELVGVKDIPPVASELGWIDQWGNKHPEDLRMSWDYMKDEKTGKAYIQVSYLDLPTRPEEW